MGRISSLRVATRCFGALLGLLILSIPLGCQSWHASTAFPGMQTTSDQRKVLQQLDRDPFPSPSDVGMQGAESRSR